MSKVSQKFPPDLDNLGFGIQNIVADLRAVRVESLIARQRLDHPPKLPSRKILAQVVEGISAALFPNRLGPPDLTDEGLDAFVAHTLDVQARALARQIRRELSFAGIGQAEERADLMVRAFLGQLPAIRRLLDTDIQAAYEGDPAAQTPDEVLVCYPGILAMIHHRLAHPLYRLGAPLSARIIAELAHSATGIDLHPGATIGENFFIDHGTGVVIGETAVIGRHVRVYQAVTLGAKRFPKNADGSLVKGNQRHPVVEDDVVIYAGATILGRITLGKGSVIGGNVWLTESIPPGSVITQTQ
ncbi:MAG: serine O-acetyltransferase EpsC [Methylococcales bacterium]|nr:serine O-acetyltransferase EpsC [Methylococcales bacterium]